VTDIGIEAPAAVRPSRTLYEVFASADTRTLDLVERRRAAGRPHRRGWLVRRALVVADVVGLAAAFLVVVAAFGARGDMHGLAEYGLMIATLPVWILLAKVYGLYDQDEERTHHPTTDDFVGVFHLVTVGTWLYFAGATLTGFSDPQLSKVLTLWVLAVASIALARTVARACCRRSVSYLQNTIIVGAGDVGQSVARKLLRHPEYGMNLVGFVDSEPKARQEGLDHVALLGSPDQLAEMIHMLDVERVIVAFSNTSSEATLELVRSLKSLPVKVAIVPRLFEVVGPGVKFDTVEALPLVELPTARPARSAQWAKRAIDIVAAGLALAVTAPLFAFVAWRVKRDSEGPVFFRQTRLGRDRVPFTALKFRTMRIDADQSAHREYIQRTMDARVAPTSNGLYKLEREDAVTASGRWLRKTSLDELPQLINVLRGEMSLVGPRPCIAYETEHFEPHHFDRFLVLPGITGLWQVTARAQATFREALDMDVAYARGWSLGLDLRLLCRTPLQVFGRRATA
jgi:exopolysaccharide biosynthesis polyprenyl glycosylphosphotransferase